MPVTSGPVYTVTTTNNTPTLLRQQTLAVGGYLVHVYARQTTQIPRVDFLHTVRTFCLYQDGEAAWGGDGTTLSLDGSVTAVATWAVDVAINGANLEVTVTGENSKTINWYLHIEHLQAP